MNMLSLAMADGNLADKQRIDSLSVGAYYAELSAIIEYREREKKKVDSLLHKE